MDRRRTRSGRPPRMGTLGSRVGAGWRGALAAGGDAKRLPRSRLGPAGPHPTARRTAPAALGGRQRRAESPRHSHEGSGPRAYALSRPLPHGAALHRAARELSPRSDPNLAPRALPRRRRARLAARPPREPSGGAVGHGAASSERRQGRGGWRHLLSPGMAGPPTARAARDPAGRRTPG